MFKYFLSVFWIVPVFYELQFDIGVDKNIEKLVYRTYHTEKYQFIAYCNFLYGIILHR